MAKLSDAAPGGHDPLVIHADAHLIVVVKPVGLLSVPGRGEHKQDCASARVQRLYPDAKVVHRLDMATSGLLLMARGVEMQRRLSQAFANREVGKRYVAVVAGQPYPPADAQDGWGLIDLPLAADWPNRPRRVVDLERGKPSQTRWRIVARESALDGTRLKLEPLTGRSHQLRVHLQAIGHPILGDSLYAPPEVQARTPRLLLHASELRLMHPDDGSPLHFSNAAPF